jgi:hypothetical protein
MLSQTGHLELASEPGTWRVTLVSGSDISATAHGYSKEGDFNVFSLLMEGAPCFEVDVLRIPVEIVSKIRGG